MPRSRNSPRCCSKTRRFGTSSRSIPQKTQYRHAGIDEIEIERTRDEVKVVLHVARPGLIIGKKGQEIELLQAELQNLIGRRVNLKIEEIPRPEVCRLSWSPKTSPNSCRSDPASDAR